MIKEFIIIVLQRQFYFCFLIPVIIYLILNIGLVFSIPNQIIFLAPFVNYVSIYGTNDQTVQVLVGAVTVVIVFFSLAQFGYSNRSIPSEIIRKYIIASEKTSMYLGLQFGYIISLSLMSIFYYNYITLINLIYAYVGLFGSALLSIMYFLWLSKNIQPKNLFLLISSQIEYDKLQIIEHVCAENQRNFNDFLREGKKTPYKISGQCLLDIHHPREIPIQTTKIGMISNIKISNIITLMKQYEECIAEINFVADIGETIPKYELLPNAVPKSTLIWIILINNCDDSELRNAIRRLSGKIGDCFEIDSSNTYSNNIDLLKDMVDFYYYFGQDQNEFRSDPLIKEMDAYILSAITKSKSSDATFQGGIREKLYIDMTKQVQKRITESDFSGYAIKKTFSFVYGMRHLAFKTKSSRLMTELLNLTESLLYLIVTGKTRHQYYLRTIILYVKEIAIIEPENESNDIADKLKLLDEYYTPVSIAAIEKASRAYYYLLLNYRSYPVAIKEFVYKDNGNIMLDLLSPMEWRLFDYSNEESFQGKQKEIMKNMLNSHVRNLLYLSIYIAIKVKEGIMKSSMLIDIAFPFTKFSGNMFYKSGIKSDAINECFYDPAFRSPFGGIWMDVFEVNQLSDPSKYDTHYKDFTFYWVLYNFYLFIKDRSIFERRKAIPSRAPLENEDGAYLNMLIRTIDTIDINILNDISEGYEMPENDDLSQPEIFLGRYKEYLFSLRNK